MVIKVRKVLQQVDLQVKGLKVKQELQRLDLRVIRG